MDSVTPSLARLVSLGLKHSHSGLHPAPSPDDTAHPPNSETRHEPSIQNQLGTHHSSADSEIAPTSNPPLDTIGGEVSA